MKKPTSCSSWQEHHTQKHEFFYGGDTSGARYSGGARTMPSHGEVGAACVLRQPLPEAKTMPGNQSMTRLCIKYRAPLCPD